MQQRVSTYWLSSAAAPASQLNLLLCLLVPLMASRESDQGKAWHGMAHIVCALLHDPPPPPPSLATESFLRHLCAMCKVRGVEDQMGGHLGTIAPST